MKILSIMELCVCPYLCEVEYEKTCHDINLIDIRAIIYGSILRHICSCFWNMVMKAFIILKNIDGLQVECVAQVTARNTALCKGIEKLSLNLYMPDDSPALADLIADGFTLSKIIFKG